MFGQLARRDQSVGTRLDDFTGCNRQGLPANVVIPPQATMDCTPVAPRSPESPTDDDDDDNNNDDDNDDDDEG